MKRAGILIIGLIFFLISCGQDEPALFEMKIETMLDINSGLNTIETFYFPINNVRTSFGAYAGSLTADDIGSIRAGNCVIEGGFNPVNYNFIEEIYINAIDPSDPTNFKEVFYLEFNPLDEDNELRLFGSLANQKDLFVNELVNLEVRIRFRVPSPGVSENRISFSLFAFAEE